ncbi:MAG: hypothetical protein EOO71_03430 [Myxococcaceae bacterium]|nr:MAG: hypothetical protein EOO71_03430 [Myxococcaceae bacterium]
MFLSSLLSVFTGAGLLAAVPFTVTVKSAGYSARSDGETVTVTQVVKKGIADKAGLQTGMTLLRISMPMRGFTSRTPLPQLNEADLQDALTPQPGEYLELNVASKDPKKKGPPSVFLQSREPVPDNPFPIVPIPKEQLSRLTSQQMNLYFVRLAQSANEARNQPVLKTEQETTAHVVKGRLEGVDGGGYTTLQVHPRLILEADCHSALEKVELSSDAGFKALTLRPAATDRTAERFVLDLPLWKTQDVVQGCTSARTALERTLRVRLSCQGKPALERDVPVKLTVSCSDTLPETLSYARKVLFLREPYEVLVGDKEPLTVDVWLERIIPRPTEAALVELDAGGKVLKRVMALPIPADPRERQTLQAPLDTTSARTLRLAVEARFADGSNWVGAPETREIRTQEQVDALTRQVVEGRAKMDAFEKRFAAKFADPCKDLPATMKWLQAQTDLEYASAEEDGHSFSYKVKGALAPLVFSCHAWK